jgi:hypothetical protein
MIAASNRQSLQYADLPSGDDIHVSLPFTVFLCVNSCHVAFVELRDGATTNSELINTFCKGIPSSQYTTGNVLYVRFFTDAPDPKNGFKANVGIGKIQLYFYCSDDNGHKRKSNVMDHRARILPTLLAEKTKFLKIIVPESV